MKDDTKYISEYVKEMMLTDGWKNVNYTDYNLVAEDEKNYIIEYEVDKERKFGGVLYKIYSLKINKKDYNKFLRNKKLIQIKLHENR